MTHYMLTPEIIGTGSTALDALADLRLKIRVYYDTSFFGSRAAPDSSRQWEQREELIRQLMADDEQDGLYR